MNTAFDMELFLAGVLTGSHTTRKRHLRQAKTIQLAIAERWERDNPWTWQRKHLAWFLNHHLNRHTELTRYYYLLTTNLITLRLAKSWDFKRERKVGSRQVQSNGNSLAWFGSYDKLTMAQQVLRQVYGLVADQEQSQVFYSGDSLNDAPMFGHFKHTLGVSTIHDCLEELPFKPTRVSVGAGGSGFVEAADAILKGQIL